MRESAKQRQKAFLREYVKSGGKVHIACAALGFTDQLHRNWIRRPDRYPEYQTLYRKARRAARKVRARMLSDAVYERAIKGTPRYGKNKNGGIVSEWWSEATGYVTQDDYRFVANPSAFVRKTLVEHVPSDNLAMFELKKLNPAYRDKQEVKLHADVNNTHRVEDLSDDELRRIAIAGRLGTAEAGAGEGVPDRLRQRGGDPGQARN